MKRPKIQLIIFIVCVISSGNLFSQAPGIDWQNTIGGTSGDELRAIQQTADGGFILGGYSASSISADKSEASLGQDYWVVKLNSSGTLDWENTIGGSGTDQLWSIQLTSDNGYILGGYSNSGISGDKTEASMGNYDYWVVKLNSAGAFEWQNTIGGSDDDKLYSVHQTADGGYILGGSSESGISGDKTQACFGNLDYWIVKLNISGSIEWQQTIGGVNDEVLASIQQSATGNYIIGGTINPGMIDNSEDYFIVKLKSTGVVQWEKIIGGSDKDVVQSVRTTLDEGYIAGGYSYSGISGHKTEANVGTGGDYWIVKLNSYGNIEWQNTIGGSGHDELHSIQQMADHGYIMGGQSGSLLASGDKTDNNFGLNDYWVVKVNSIGTVQWERTVGAALDDWLYSVQQTHDGEFVIAGSSNSGVGGNKTEACIGNMDYWVLKLYEDCSSTTVFADADGDGYGDATTGIFDLDCVPPAGYVTNNTDCNDHPQSGASIHPSAIDKLNGIDDDCDGLIDEDICPVPVDLIAEVLSATSVILKWDFVAAAKKYKISYWETGGGAHINVLTTENSKLLTNLSPDTKYKWKVQSNCKGNGLGSSDWSVIKTFTTDPLRLASTHEDLNFEVYPNPASVSFTIQFSLQNSSAAEICIFDLQGRKIKTIGEGSFPEGDHLLSFSAEDLNKGIYFIQLKTVESVASQKLIVH